MATDNKTATEIPRCPIYMIDVVLNIYLINFINILGIMYNLICVYVFSRIVKSQRNEGHMFKYLLVKAIHDSISFLTNIFYSQYFCESCEARKFYIVQIWYIWFYG